MLESLVISIFVPVARSAREADKSIMLRLSDVDICSVQEGNLAKQLSDDKWIFGQQDVFNSTLVLWGC